MISPKSITVSLEWAKKLQAAGFHQGWTAVGTMQSFSERPETMVADIMGTYFKWFDVRSDYRKGNPSPEVDSIYCNYPMIADAPTAEEILRRLPRYLPWKDDSDNMAALFVNIFPSTYRVGYSPQWTKDAWSTPDAETLADAAAACYCYLAEHNLLPS